MDGTRLDFKPFQAWRYDPNRVKLDEAVAPPYDVISPEERETLYRKSPFNVVRLILGKETNFYETAAGHWQKWSREGILVQDKAPTIYLYEQSFQHPWDSKPLSRLALVGILRLDESGGVLRHEATFDAPKRDRLELLKKTKTNLSPIFGLYQNSQKMRNLFSAFQKKPPLFQAHDGEGVSNRVWAVQELKDQKLIQETLASEKIMIADGHHRYETALEYQKQMRLQSQNTSNDNAFDFVMMALVGEDDPGLLVLPTHRIVRSLEICTEEELLRQLKGYFDFFPCSEKEIFPALLRRFAHEKVFGVIFQTQGSYLIQLKNQDEARKVLPEGKPPLWYEIEANLLTYLVFNVLWKATPQRRQDLVVYTRSSDEAIQAVHHRKAQVSFLLRSPEVDTIRKLAYAGEHMPQKTTYFYPKLASGLLFYHHGI